MSQPRFACPLCGIELPKPEIYFHAETCEGFPEPALQPKPPEERLTPRAFHVDPNAAPHPPPAESERLNLPVHQNPVPASSSVGTARDTVPPQLQQEENEHRQIRVDSRIKSSRIRDASPLSPPSRDDSKPLWTEWRSDSCFEGAYADSTQLLDARRQLRLDDLCRKHHRDIQAGEQASGASPVKESMQLVTRDRLFTGLFGDPYITNTELEGGPVADTLGSLSGFLKQAAAHFKRGESAGWLSEGRVSGMTTALEKASKVFARNAIAEAMTTPVMHDQPLQREKQLMDRAKSIRAQLLAMSMGDWAALPAGWVTRLSTAHAVTLLIHRTPEGFDWILCNTGAGVNRHSSFDAAFPKVKYAVAAPLGSIPSDRLSLAFLYFLVRANTVPDENHTEHWFYDFLLPAQFGDESLRLDPATLPEEVGFPRSAQRAGTCYLKANLAALKVILSAHGLSHDEIKIAMLALRYVVLQDALQSLTSGSGPKKGIYVSDEKLLRIACHQLLLKAEKNVALGRVKNPAVLACSALTDAIITSLPSALVDAPEVLQPLVEPYSVVEDPVVDPDGEHQNAFHHVGFDLVVGGTINSLAGKPVPHEGPQNISFSLVEHFTSVADIAAHITALGTTFSPEVLCTCDHDKLRMVRYRALAIIEELVTSKIGIPQYLDPTGVWQQMIEPQVKDLNTRAILTHSLLNLGMILASVCSNLPDTPTVVSKHVLLQTALCIDIEHLNRTQENSAGESLKKYLIPNPLDRFHFVLEVLSLPLLRLWSACHQYFMARPGDKSGNLFSSLYSTRRSSWKDDGELETRLSPSTPEVVLLQFLGPILFGPRAAGDAVYHLVAGRLNDPRSPSYGMLLALRDSVFLCSTATNAKDSSSAVVRHSRALRQGVGFEFVAFSNAEGGLLVVTSPFRQAERDEPDKKKNPPPSLLAQGRYDDAFACVHEERSLLMKPTTPLAEGLTTEMDVHLKQFISYPLVGLPLFFEEIAQSGLWSHWVRCTPVIRRFLFSPRWPAAKDIDTPSEAPLNAVPATQLGHLAWHLLHAPEALLTVMAKVVRNAVEESASYPEDYSPEPLLSLVAIVAPVHQLYHELHNHSVANPSVPIDPLGLALFEGDDSLLAKVDSLISRSRDDKEWRRLNAHRALLLTSWHMTFNSSASCATPFENGSSSVAAISLLQENPKIAGELADSLAWNHLQACRWLIPKINSLPNSSDRATFLSSCLCLVTRAKVDIPNWHVVDAKKGWFTDATRDVVVNIDDGAVSLSSKSSPQSIPEDFAATPEYAEAFGSTVTRGSVGPRFENRKSFLVWLDSTKYQLDLWGGMLKTFSLWVKAGVMKPVTGVAPPSAVPTPTALFIGPIEYRPTSTQELNTYTKNMSFQLAVSQLNKNEGSRISWYKSHTPQSAATSIRADYGFSRFACVMISSRSTDSQGRADAEPPCLVAEVWSLESTACPVTMVFDLTIIAGKLARTLIWSSHYARTQAFLRAPSNERSTPCLPEEMFITGSAIPSTMTPVSLGIQATLQGGITYELVPKSSLHGIVPGGLTRGLSLWRREKTIHCLEVGSGVSPELLTSSFLRLRLEGPSSSGTVARIEERTRHGTTRLLLSVYQSLKFRSSRERSCSTFFRGAVDCLGRMDFLGCLSPWMPAKSPRPDGRLLLSDLTFVLNRVHMTWEVRQLLKDDGLMYYGLGPKEFQGYRVSNCTRPEVLPAITGLAHGVLVENDALQLAVIVGAVPLIRPVVKSCPFSISTVPELLSLDTYSKVYLCPLHSATWQLMPETLEATLYALYCKLKAREYDSAFTLAERASSVGGLSSSERIILKLILPDLQDPQNLFSGSCSIDFDAHPNAIAVVLRLLMSVCGNEFGGASPCPTWPAGTLYMRYLATLQFTSPSCRIPLTHESAYLEGLISVSTNRNRWFSLRSTTSPVEKVQESPARHRTSIPLGYGAITLSGVHAERMKALGQSLESPWPSAPRSYLPIPRSSSYSIEGFLREPQLAGDSGHGLLSLLDYLSESGTVPDIAQSDTSRMGQLIALYRLSTLHRCKQESNNEEYPFTVALLILSQLPQATRKSLKIPTEIRNYTDRFYLNPKSYRLPDPPLVLSYLQHVCSALASAADLPPPPAATAVSVDRQYAHWFFVTKRMRASRLVPQDYHAGNRKVSTVTLGTRDDEVRLGMRISQKSRDELTSAPLKAIILDLCATVASSRCNSDGSESELRDMSGPPIPNPEPVFVEGLLNPSTAGNQRHLQPIVALCDRLQRAATAAVPPSPEVDPLTSLLMGREIQRTRLMLQRMWRALVKLLLIDSEEAMRATDWIQECVTSYLPTGDGESQTNIQVQLGSAFSAVEVFHSADLLVIARQTQDSHFSDSLKAVNQHLTPSLVTDLADAAVASMLLWSRVSQLRKALGVIANCIQMLSGPDGSSSTAVSLTSSREWKSQVGTLAKIVFAERCYTITMADNEKYLNSSYLFFEFAFEVLMWKAQRDLLSKLADTAQRHEKSQVSGEAQDEKTGLISQVLMGMGKSSVVTPLAAMALLNNLLARRREEGSERGVVTVVAPQALIPQVLSVAGHRFTVLTGAPVVRVFCSRGGSDGSRLERQVTLIQRTNGILVGDPDDVKAVLLCRAEFVLNSRSQSSAGHFGPKVVRAFKAGYCLLDEADSVLNPLRSELNFPMGQKEALAPYRWTFAMAFLDRMIHSLGSDRAIPPLAVATAPHVHVINVRWFQGEYLQPTVAAAMSALGSLDPKGASVLTDESIRAALHRFLMDRSIIALEPAVAQRLQNAGILNGLVMLAKLWIHSYAPHVLSKVYNVSYGFPSAERQLRDPSRILAVPYLAQGAPSETSEFAHPDICIGLTFLTFLHAGMRDSDFLVLVQSLQRQLATESGPIPTRRTSKLFFNLLSSEGPESESKPPPLHTIDILDTTRIIQLCKVYGKLSKVIEHFLSHVVFPEVMKFSRMKLSASAQELANDILFGCTVGFTGTTDDCAPKAIRMDHAEADLQKVLRYLSHPEICSVRVINGGSSRSIIDELPAAGLLKDCVIDCGGLLSEFSNEQIARAFLERLQGSKDVAVFLGPDDRPRYVTKDPSIPSSHLAECSSPLKRRFVFFDQAHCTGCDIIQSAAASAAILIGKDSDLRDVAQGAWRMRHLGTGAQNVTLCLPTFVEALMKQNKGLAKAIGCDKLQQALITWLALTSIRVQEPNAAKLLQQEAECEPRQAGVSVTLRDDRLIGSDENVISVVRKAFATSIANYLDIPEFWNDGPADNDLDTNQQQQQQQQQQQEQQQEQQQRSFSLWITLATDERWIMRDLFSSPSSSSTAAAGAGSDGRPKKTFVAPLGMTTSSSAHHGGRQDLLPPSAGPESSNRVLATPNFMRTARALKEEPETVLLTPHIVFGYISTAGQPVSGVATTLAEAQALMLFTLSRQRQPNGVGKAPKGVAESCAVFTRGGLRLCATASWTEEATRALLQLLPFYRFWNAELYFSENELQILEKSLILAYPNTERRKVELLDLFLQICLRRRNRSSQQLKTSDLVPRIVSDRIPPASSTSASSSSSPAGKGKPRSGGGSADSGRGGMRFSTGSGPSRRTTTSSSTNEFTFSSLHSSRSHNLGGIHFNLVQTPDGIRLPDGSRVSDLLRSVCDEMSASSRIFFSSMTSSPEGVRVVERTVGPSTPPSATAATARVSETGKRASSKPAGASSTAKAVPTASSRPAFTTSGVDRKVGPRPSSASASRIPPVTTLPRTSGSPAATPKPSAARPVSSIVTAELARQEKARRSKETDQKKKD